MGEPSPDGGGRDGGRDSGGVDAGGVDASGRDSGGGGSSLLATMGCDAALSSTLLVEEFSDEPTEFRGLSGSFRVEGGHVVIAPPDYALLESIGAFNDVVACAHVRIARSTSGEHRLGTGLRGPMHGVNLILAADEGVARLMALEPATNVVVAQQPIRQWTGSAEQEFVVLVYLSGSRTYAEVKHVGSGEVVVLGGTYRGEMLAVNATFEGSPLVQEVRVDRVVVGPPTPAAAAVLNGG